MRAALNVGDMGLEHSESGSGIAMRCTPLGMLEIAIYSSQVTYTTIAGRLRVITLKVDQP